MTDLLAAAQKQIEYAGNEFASGDTAKGQTHLDKASSFIQRAAGQSAAAPAADSKADDGPLSDDMAEAAQQLLERYGFGRGSSPDAASIIEASGDEGREAAFLGLLGVPGTFPAADYSLFEQYYERTNLSDDGSSSWAPKAEWANSGSGWKHYVETKGS